MTAPALLSDVQRVERRPVIDRASWLRMRHRNIGGSEVGALFGAHPYTTPFELFANKRAAEPVEIDSPVLRRGRLFEGAVAIAASEERSDWRVWKATDYFADPALRLGATPDFWIDDDGPRGIGVMQAKTVAPAVFARDWEDNPPLWVILQAATEMMLTGSSWGVVAALVIDPWNPALHLYEIPRHEGAEVRIRAAVAAFWMDFEAGREPSPDFARDARAIATLYGHEVAGKAIDLSTDNRMGELLAYRADLRSHIKANEAALETVETEIKAKLADAEKATLPGWRITWKTQKRKAYSVAESSARVLRITDLRQKEAAE